MSKFQIVLVSNFLALCGYLLIPYLDVQYLATGLQRSFKVDFGAYKLPADRIEKKYTSSLEAAFSTIPHIKEIRSKSSDNGGSLELDLDNEADSEYVRFEIASKIRSLYPDWSDEVTYPQISLVDPDEKSYRTPLLIYSISAPTDMAKLNFLASEKVAPPLGSLNDVESVEISGYRRPIITIYLDQSVLDAFHLNRTKIKKQIADYFRDIPIGIAELNSGQNLELKITTDKSNSSTELQSIETVPIFTGNRYVLLSRLATIKKEEEEVSRYFRVNGKNALRLSIYGKSSANDITSSSIIKNKIAELKSDLDSSVEFTLESDNSFYLQKELKKIYLRSGLSLLILLVMLVFSYKNSRQVFLVISSLIVNLGLAFLFYYFLGIQLNLYSLAGITITFGLVMDNAIIMSHQISTKHNTKIKAAIITATLTTLSSLVVIYFLPENLRAQLTYFSAVIVINLLISVVVSSIYVPALYSLLFQESLTASSTNDKFLQVKKWYSHYFDFAQRYRKAMIVMMILLFGLPVFLLPTHWEGHDWYNKTIGSDWYTDRARPIVNRALGGTLRLFSIYVYQKGGIRSPENTKLYVNCRTPQGTPPDQTNTLISYIENYLGRFGPKLEVFKTWIYNGESARIEITFPNEGDYTFPYILKNSLISYCSQFGGSEWNIYGVGKGYNNSTYNRSGNFNVDITGFNRIKIGEIANGLKSKLEEHPRVKDVETDASMDWFARDKKVFQLRVKNDHLADNNVTSNELFRVIDRYNQRSNVETISKQLLPLRFKYNDSNTRDLWSLENEINLVDGKAVKAGDFVLFQALNRPTDIHKVNQEYIQRLKFTYTGSNRFGQKYLDEVLDQINPSLPLGYALKDDITSGFFLKEKTKRNYYSLLFIFLSVFIICAIHFESFRYPLLVLLLIPLSFIGIFLIFYWTGASFDQGGFTSFILVSGLTVNSLIYILDDYKRNKLSMSVKDAFLEAFYSKILPVYLSIISTVLGLIPFVLIGKDDVFWSGLAWGGIGGLLFSLLIIVFVMPAFLGKVTKPSSSKV